MWPGTPHYLELHAKIVQLKLRSSDGRMRETDTADTETTLRIGVCSGLGSALRLSVPPLYRLPSAIWQNGKESADLAGLSDAVLHDQVDKPKECQRRLLVVTHIKFARMYCVFANHTDHIECLLNCDG